MTLDELVIFIRNKIRLYESDAEECEVEESREMIEYAISVMREILINAEAGIYLPEPTHELTKPNELFSKSEIDTVIDLIEEEFYRLIQNNEPLGNKVEVKIPKTITSGDVNHEVIKRYGEVGWETVRFGLDSTNSCIVYTFYRNKETK